MFNKLGSNKKVAEYLNFLRNEGNAKLMFTTLSEMGLLTDATKKTLEALLINFLKETTN